MIVSFIFIPLYLYVSIMIQKNNLRHFLCFLACSTPKRVFLYYSEVFLKRVFYKIALF